MKLETFLEKFHLIADAPNSVPQLRAMILELAVRGRLVLQHQGDEPANKLLKRVGSSGSAKSATSLHSRPGEEPYEIPPNWAWVRLPQVLKKLTDGTHHSPPNGPIGDVKYVTAKNIKNDGVVTEEITYVSRVVHDEIYTRCDPSFGDVLYIKDGATTGIATINQLTEPFSLLSSVALLKPSPAVLNRYLLWTLRSPFFFQQTRGAMKGAAITRVTLSVLAASLLPVPPLAEQKRIVAKVDELMALCDRLETQLQERDTRHAALARAALARFAEAPTPANLELLFHDSFTIDPADLRKTILGLAVSGRLVVQDSNDQSASTTEQGQDFPGVQLPPGWKNVRVAELLATIQTGPFGSALHKSDYQRSGTPVVNPASIRDGAIVPNPGMAVGPDTLNRLATFRLKAGDIVMARRGEMGRCAVVTEREEGWLCGTGSLVLRLREVVDARYLALVIGSPPAREYLGGACIGTTMKNLNQSILAKMEVPLPPFAEQRRIVAQVDELMALVDRLEARQSAARAAGEKLLGAMVAELLQSDSQPPREQKAKSQTQSANS